MFNYRKRYELKDASENLKKLAKLDGIGSGRVVPATCGTRWMIENKNKCRIYSLFDIVNAKLAKKI